MSSIHEKIKKQIEFYFSNANMRTDKFLQTKTKENDGWIDINTLLLFSKLKALSTDPATIKDAIKESVVVEYKMDDILHIRKLVNDDYLNYLKCDNDKKVLVVKGFDKKKSFDEIETFLGGYIDFVLMRMVRDKNKEFVGIVFVELRNEEDIDKVLAMQIPVEVENADTNASVEVNDKENCLVESGTEPVKKQKLNDDVLENFLSISKKVDYFKDRVAKRKTEKEEQMRENIIGQLKGKFYKYTTNKELDIKTIKKVIENLAFVDLKNNTCRFKKSQDFEEKTFELEDNKIELRKLNDEEEAEYCKNIKFSDVLSKGKRKQKTTKK